MKNNGFEINDIVVVTIANPDTLITGVVKSEAFDSSDGKQYFIHWADGTKQYWRGDRLTKIEIKK